jgi:phage shock protein PspC (stress-responsive transcriptional regulator)
MPASKKEPEPQRLFRSETDKVIAGVAGGLGEYFKIDPTIIRILFILLTIFGGSGLIIYIVLWLVMPPKSSVNGLGAQSIKSNIEDIKSTTRTFAHNISSPKDNKENSKFWWAILIIAIGFIFLLNNYGILAPLDLQRLWPLILILFGLAIILRK